MLSPRIPWFNSLLKLHWCRFFTYLTNGRFSQCNCLHLTLQLVFFFPILRIQARFHLLPPLPPAFALLSSLHLLFTFTFLICDGKSLTLVLLFANALCDLQVEFLRTLFWADRNKAKCFLLWCIGRLSSSCLQCQKSLRSVFKHKKLAWRNP